MIDFFSCTPFISGHRFLNNAVTLMADISRIVKTLLALNDVIMFSDVNLIDGVHDVHYNQCIPNT